jgi:hypothetical protein
MTLVGKAAEERDLLERQIVPSQMPARLFDFLFLNKGVRSYPVVSVEFAGELNRPHSYRRGSAPDRRRTVAESLTSVGAGANKPRGRSQRENLGTVRKFGMAVLLATPMALPAAICMKLGSMVIEETPVSAVEH